MLVSHTLLLPLLVELAGEIPVQPPILWKSYPPDARWARYWGSAAFRGTRNQETRTPNKQQSQGKTAVLFKQHTVLLQKGRIVLCCYLFLPPHPCSKRDLQSSPPQPSPPLVLVLEQLPVNT